MLINQTNFKESGFTLLEILISLSVIGVGLLALFQLESRSITQWHTIQQSLKTHTEQNHWDDSKIAAATCHLTLTALELTFESCTAPELRIPHLVVGNEL